MKVLIVDDSATARLFVKKVLQMVIQNEDVIVREVDSGENALKELMKDSVYDLVLSDVNMPEMSGFTFMHNLRLNDSLQKIPIVFVTSISNVSNSQKLVELGAFAVLPKPLSVQSLEKIVSSLRLVESRDTNESEWGV